MAQAGPEIVSSDHRYIDRRGNLMRSRTELTVARMLEFLGHEYEYDAEVQAGGAAERIDFRTAGGMIEAIDGDEDAARYARIRAALPGERMMAVGHPRYAAQISELGDPAYYDEAPQAGSIFLEDPSFSFDYAHVLPLVEKCSILHGHTSSVMVELAGQMRDGLLLDFGEAKALVRRVVESFDHKFFINKEYLASEDGGHYTVRFDGPRGEFELRVPRDTAHLLEGEATVENLATEMIRRLAPLLPPNVEAVGVYIYEGYNKGSHIISRIPGRRDGA